MSYHWENVIWQSKDGSWNRGYSKRISMANSPSAWEDPDYGYDAEWDDEFDGSEFDHLKTGMRTLEDAHDFTPSGNPGTHVEIPYKGNSRSCKELDLMAFHHSNPEAKAKHDRAIHNRKRREHFAELEKEWVAEDFANRKLVVSLKNDDTVYDPMGAFTDVSGYPVREGDWLTIEGRKVRNMKTGKFHNRVSRIDHDLRVRRRW